MKRELTLGKDFYTVSAHSYGSEYETAIEGKSQEGTQFLSEFTNKLEHIEDDNYQVVINGNTTPVVIVTHGEKCFIKAFGRNFTIDVIDPIERASEQSGSSNLIKAPMPGMVVEVNVEVGEQVVAGQKLLSIESMKIMTVIRAWRDGEIHSIGFTQDDTFDKNAVLVSMVEEEE